MEGTTDQDIWTRVIAGEAREFGVIWDRHCERILGYLARLEGNRSDAEDLTAVVFLELWRHRHNIRFVDGSALPWLILTARNVQRNAARSRRRYRAMLAKLPPASHSIADIDPSDPRTPLITEVLATCKGADQDLAILTAVEGFTVAEAAQAVGITEPAARMRLSRLRTKIRSAVTAGTPLEGGTQ